MNVSIGIMLGKIGAFSDSDEKNCKLENSIKKFHHEVLTTV